MNKHNLSTSSFKNIVTFILKLLVALVLLIGYINHVLPQYEQGYNASLIDKVDRLESINQPKIVLIGHSNLTFGINSELIEKAMEMPVVNMGLHGGNGNAFHEEMAKYNVVPGDIYVLCHSDFNDDNLIPEPMTAWSSIENHPKLWKLLRINDVKTMVRTFSVYLKKCLGLYSSGTGNQDPTGLYARSAFNEYGDVELLREGSQYTFESKVGVPGIGDVTVERINKLNSYLTQRGATLVVAGYPIGNGKLTVDASEFVNFQKQLSERLDCPVISNYIDYMFDYKYFYNTNLHLNSEGANLRTEQLVSDLKRWQQTGTEAIAENDEYSDIIADNNLPHINDIYGYLDALLGAKDRYTIIISAKDDASSAMNEEITKRLKALGLSADWSQGFRYSYAAVIEKGKLISENFEHEKIEISGTFDHNRMKYSITSGGWDRGCTSSILLNGQEYSENARGLNIVVYSNETHRILDEVTFDTSIPDLTVTR